MRKFCRRCMAFSLVFIVLGGIFVGVGVGMGASFDSLPNLVLGPFSDNRKREDISLTFEEVMSIEIDATAANIHIIEGNQFGVEGRSVPIGVLQAKVEDGVLMVEYDLEDSAWRRSIRWGENHTPRITVTVPANIVLEKLDVDINVGQLRIEGIKTNIAQMELNTGNMELHRFFAHTSDISCDVGRIYLEGMLEGDTQISCNVGDITLKLAQEQKMHNYDVETNVGRVRMNGRGHDGINGSYEVNSGADSWFYVTCDIGNVMISTQDLDLNRGGRGNGEEIV